MAKKKAIKARKKKGTEEDSRKPDVRYFAILDLSSKTGCLTLITPNSEYIIGDGRGVLSVKPVEDYDVRVRKEMKRMTGRILVGEGFLSGDYRVQFNRRDFEPKLS